MAITLVQSKLSPSGTATPVSSIQVTLNSPVAAGNTIYVLGNYFQPSKLVNMFPSDNLGNTYNVAGNLSAQSGVVLQGWCVQNAKAGTTAVTIAFSENATYPNLIVAEFSGLAMSGPIIDAVSVAQGQSGGTTLTGSTVTPTRQNEIILSCLGIQSGGSLSAGAGYTSIGFTGGAGLEYKVVSAIAAQTSTFGVTVSGNVYVIITVSLNQSFTQGQLTLLGVG